MISSLRFIVLFLTVFVVYSCKNSANKKIENPKNNSNEFLISNFENLFVKNNVQKFERGFVFKEFYNFPDKTFPNEIKEKYLECVFQGSKISLNNYDYKPLFYSIQKNDNFQSITVIGMDEDWCQKEALLNFNQNGKLISSTILYEDGGDGGYSTDSWGEFLNDSTYKKTSINCEPDDLNPEILIYDSCINLIHIKKSGEILNEKIFTKKVKTN